MEKGMSNYNSYYNSKLWSQGKFSIKMETYREIDKKILYPWRIFREKNIALKSLIYWCNFFIKS
jgi:hypothetical protein